MKLHLDIEVVNQVLGYLGTRPYQEVYGKFGQRARLAKTLRGFD